MHKNKFWTFMFAMIPGCGHMYLGYMKRGTQFMTMFALSSYFTMMFMGWFRNFDAVGVMFAIFLPVIWFYQIFDAMHTISHMKRLDIIVPEDDGFFIPGITNITNLNALNFFKKRGIIKAGAAILICVGVYALFTNISNGIYSIISNYYVNNTYIQNQIWQIYHTIDDYVLPVIISLLLIFAGIKLLKGKDSNDNNNQIENNTDGGE